MNSEMHHVAAQCPQENENQHLQVEHHSVIAVQCNQY